MLALTQYPTTMACGSQCPFQLSLRSITEEQIPSAEEQLAALERFVCGSDQSSEQSALATNGEEPDNSGTRPKYDMRHAARLLLRTF